jgi:hypothetical protein
MAVALSSVLIFLIVFFVICILSISGYLIYAVFVKNKETSSTGGNSEVPAPDIDPSLYCVNYDVLTNYPRGICRTETVKDCGIQGYTDGDNVINILFPYADDTNNPVYDFVSAKNGFYDPMFVPNPSVNVILLQPDFSDEDCNEVVKLWVNGSNDFVNDPNLRLFTVSVLITGVYKAIQFGAWDSAAVSGPDWSQTYRLNNDELITYYVDLQSVQNPDSNYEKDRICRGDPICAVQTDGICQLFPYSTGCLPDVLTSYPIGQRCAITQQFLDTAGPVVAQGMVGEKDGAYLAVSDFDLDRRDIATILSYWADSAAELEVDPARQFFFEAEYVFDPVGLPSGLYAICIMYYTNGESFDLSATTPTAEERTYFFKEDVEITVHPYDLCSGAP